MSESATSVDRVQTHANSLLDMREETRSFGQQGAGK